MLNIIRNNKPCGSIAATGFVHSMIKLVKTASLTEPPESDESDTQQQQSEQGQAILVQHWDSFDFGWRRR